jgi:hypothetical protein
MGPSVARGRVLIRDVDIPLKDGCGNRRGGGSKAVWFDAGSSFEATIS